MRGRGLLLVGLAVALASSSRAQAVGSCMAGTAQRVLENERLRASVFNTGSLFFGGSTTSGDGYLIPKQDSTSTIFAAGLWLGGQVNGERRVAAARYGSWDFWPGPLADAEAPPADCSAHDRIFVVSREDIARYLTTGEATADLRDWPHHLGAPVLDGDSDPTNYDLRAGDQPDLIGDVAAWWVMNDAGNEHGASGPNGPLGVEVRAQAFVYGLAGTPRSPVLTSTTFIRYEILNRSAQTIGEMYAALFSNPDLGDPVDDYVGSDTLNHMVYVYNATDEDSEFGPAPPAQGIQILRGPAVEGDTLQSTSMSSLYNCGGATDCSDPQFDEAYYHQMRGLWPNGRPIFEFRDGFEQQAHTTTTTRFMYAGDPVTEAFWSELNIDGRGTDSPRGDRRMVISTGPFRLAPGASSTLLFAFPYARGTSHLDSVSELRRVASVLQGASALGAFDRSLRVGPDAPTSGNPDRPLTLTAIRPNPASGAARAVLTLPTGTRVRATVYDALGRQLEIVADGVLPEGANALAMPDALAPGTYLLRVEVPGATETLPFTIVR